MLAKEEWKNVKGYEELYMVSSYGRIRGKRRVVYGMIEGEMQPLYVQKPQILSPIDHGNGYLYITFIKDGVRKNHYIHRLVAETFIPNPDNLPQVNHIDYDRRNNKVSNLEWVTAKDNLEHSRCNIKHRHSCHTNSGHRYITLRDGKYRVCVGKPRIDKSFKTLEEAIAFRNYYFECNGVKLDE